MIGTRGRFALVVVNVGAVAALLAVPGGPGGTAPVPLPVLPYEQAATTVPSGSTAQVVEITNAERAAAGCPALQVDPRLTAAAQLHSEDMAANGYFSHTSQDGRTFVDRIRAQGYPSPGAENIAKGYRGAAEVMAGWMASDGHRRNILNCSLRAIGVGLGTGNVWTQDFGFAAPAVTTPPAPTTTTRPPTPSTGPAPSSTPATTTRPATTAPATTAPATTAPAGGQAAEVVRLTNAERATAGCPALRVDARITRAAQLHSEDMSANGYFSHTSRDGRTFADRIRAQGYPAPAAENIARGQRSASAVVRAWMNSAGHRRNILNCSLRAIGVGFAPGNVWTQDFGR